METNNNPTIMNIKHMYKLKNTLILLFLIILLNGSCKNIFRKDLSMTPQQYMGQGMPAYNRSWTEQDFQKAQNVINSLKIKDFYSLPRNSSRRSGEVFRRITSKENLSFLEDTTLSLQAKAYRILSIGNMTGQMGTLYFDKLKTKQYYSEELTEIYIAHLYIRGKMLELAEKIENSTSQEDILMRSGRNGIVSSYVLLITFLAGEQEKTRAFAVRDQKRLSKELLNSIEENIQYLDSGNKQKIITVIKAANEKLPSGNISKNYRQILRLIGEC
jgi:hypothetical protein